METIFPDKETTGYNGLFIVGERKTDVGTFEKTGTVILKRTYGINTMTGQMTPFLNGESLDLFLTDVPMKPPKRNIFQYEHDLAPFKPEGDIIVLGFLPEEPFTIMTVKLKVNHQTWLRRSITNLPFRKEYHLFGWEKRVGTTRESEGKYLPNGNPTNEFNNRFFNGYLRESILPKLPYFSGNESIEIIRDNSLDYFCKLPADNPSAAFFTFQPGEPDEESHWQKHEIDLNIDTLVIEPERENEQDRAYLILRGVWPLDLYKEEDYRKLIVEV